MMDHFTKYGWVISLKDNKAEPILRALKNVSSNIIFLISIRLINEESSKQCSENLCESKRIARIYGVYYNPLHQGTEKVFN